MIETTIADDVPERADSTGLRIERTEDDPIDSGQHQSAGTHRAGLEGHDQGAAREPPPADRSSGRAQGQDLGMRRRVASRLARVGTRSDDVTGSIDDDGTDRDVAAGNRESSLAQREPHERLVGADQR